MYTSRRRIGRRRKVKLRQRGQIKHPGTIQIQIPKLRQIRQRGHIRHPGILQMQPLEVCEHLQAL
ncbi:hypothetical protein D805_0329 [Bifidobacterium thermophilum RBL67]|uniref:Uncharacterized protein n=1 Tax=Bifidobacterium thermophilum RBL67 TaxID=1254439 RepID=M4RAW0_9BIFI|nr:hypothetical protein D805_0329 [Bifidobacterium thermophilum RBL67]